LHTQSKFRLLVVRLGAMGDILHALPAMTALRQAHPSWIIDWVVEPRWSSLLSARADAEAVSAIGVQSQPRNASQPVVDHLHFAHTRAWRKDPLSRKTLYEIRSLRKALRSAHYDVALDLQGAIRSAVVARLAGCRRLIGEAQPRERIARWLFNERIETRGVHVIEQDLELAASIAGDDLRPVPPRLPIDSSAEAWADSVLAPHASPPAVLVNPGAGWGAKRWPVERYAAVAQGLIEQGMRVFVNVGPGEEPLAQAIAQAAPGTFPVACTLSQLIALTRRIALVIAGDTGPLHLACALQRPVVGLYGPTDPSRNGPFGTRFKVLRSPFSRRDHTRHAAPEAGLLTITPTDVLTAVHELLVQELAS
jgi:heptosyltransferase-1